MHIYERTVSPRTLLRHVVKSLSKIEICSFVHQLKKFLIFLECILEPCRYGRETCVVREACRGKGSGGRTRFIIGYCEREDFFCCYNL